MNLDRLSKECMIIAIFALLLSLLMAANQADELMRDDVPEEYRTAFIKGSSLRLGGLMVNILVSILLIFGIVKKQYLLMVPWLLVAFVAVALSLIYFLASFVTLPFGHLQFMVPMIVTFGLETLILYPLCTLCHELRLKGNEPVILLPK